MQTCAAHAQDKWRSLKSAVMGNKDTRRVALKEEWKVKIREIAEAAERCRVGRPDAAEPQVGAHGMGLGGPASDQAPPQARTPPSQVDNKTLLKKWFAWRGAWPLHECCTFAEAGSHTGLQVWSEELEPWRKGWRRAGLDGRRRAGAGAPGADAGAAGHDAPACAAAGAGGAPGPPAGAAGDARPAARLTAPGLQGQRVAAVAQRVRAVGELLVARPGV